MPCPETGILMGFRITLAGTQIRQMVLNIFNCPAAAVTCLFTQCNSLSIFMLMPMPGCHNHKGQLWQCKPDYHGQRFKLKKRKP